MTPPSLRTRLRFVKYLLVTMLSVQWFINFLQTYLLILAVFFWKSQDSLYSGGQLSELTASEEQVLNADAFLGYFTILYAVILTTWTAAGVITLIAICVEWPLPVLFLAVLQSIIVFIKLVFYFWPDTGLRLTLIAFDTLLAGLLFYFERLVREKSTLEHVEDCAGDGV